jgi:hypothetical protein
VVPFGGGRHIPDSRRLVGGFQGPGGQAAPPTPARRTRWHRPRGRTARVARDATTPALRASGAAPRGRGCPAVSPRSLS